jgi:hypothetical protein
MPLLIIDPATRFKRALLPRFDFLPIISGSRGGQSISHENRERATN